MADRYNSYIDLAANERLDIDYRIRVLDRGSEAVILAPHGGWIEPETSKIAEAISGTVFSFYAFESPKKRAARPFSHNFPSFRRTHGRRTRQQILDGNCNPWKAG